MSTPYLYAQSPVVAAFPISSAAPRRQHAVQPPNLLTTSLENARSPAVGGAAASTPTSLSTPFSAHPARTPYPESPGAAMREASPMNFRSNLNFSSTYNPQQWGPVNEASSSSATILQRQQQSQHLASRLHGPDEPVASPPPPYSPRRDPNAQISPRDPCSLATPSDTTSPDTDHSRYGTPVSAATTLSPDLYSGQQRGQCTITSQPVSTTLSPQTTSAPLFPPPPAAANSRSRNRTTSKLHTSGILQSLRSKPSSSTVTADAITLLQEDTYHALAQPLERSSDDGPVYPPAARRAASTGAIGLAGSSRSNGISSSPVIWQMHNPQIPPPPPGPPPTANRSQSLNRFTESPSSLTAPGLPLRTRLRPGTGTTLETVPPTPADWRDESPGPKLEPLRNSSKGPAGPTPLHIDTGSILHRRKPGETNPATATGATPTHIRRDSSATGLFRSPAVRTRSAKGLRERRSESKNGKGRAVEDCFDDQLHSALPAEEEEEIDVRPRNLKILHKTSKSSPKSGTSIQSLDGAMKSADSSQSSVMPLILGSADSSVRPTVALAPALSPTKDKFGNDSAGIGSPGPHQLMFSEKAMNPASLSVPSSNEVRPLSHLLHMPNSAESMQIPLTPSTKASQRPVSDLIALESPGGFAMRANERHKEFAAREAQASTDSERLDLFVRFMIAESRIRRQQYATVFEEEDVHVDEIARDLFSEQEAAEEVTKPRQRESHENSQRTSIASSAVGDSSSQGESSMSRKNDSPISISTDGSTQHKAENGWTKDFVPCLSPIASMSIATGQDEVESRGRTPSRWWEGSRSGETGSGDGFNVLARSRRETKYMGVPKEARHSAALYDNRLSGSWHAAGTSYQQPIPVDEYPLEKVGWHEQSQQPIPPPALPPTPASAPFTPDPRHLDISRLVNLPPPYPRHHPAVNNSHPELAEIRQVKEKIDSRDEVNSIRERYTANIMTKRQRAASWQDHARSIHQQDIEFRISQGELSSEAYEAAESDLQLRIDRSQQEIVQADFDLFQTAVVSPIHGIFTERIRSATASLERLSTHLWSDAQSHSPNLPQEQGDERAELLENLTMLKYLFQAREACHRQIYDLLSERNDKYKAIVLLPYKQHNNTAKSSEALTFFANDAADRKRAYERSVSDRAQAFLSIIERNVSRGVEVQLDAFWQIAPSLKSLLHKIPEGSGRPGPPPGFEIQIPPDEYEENPSYYDHPLQYLYSLLGHAQKSTYQFIESQVNLLCLMHEIRNAALAAKMRVYAGEQEVASAAAAAGGALDQQKQSSRTNELERQQRHEEARLTADLKDQVGVVEGQWEEALGEELMAVRERVRGWLLEAGGWEDDSDGDV